MELLVGAAEALGWGVWMAVNPCPMATNIAAVSFVGRKAGRPWLVLLGGLLYALGRTLVYVTLAVLLVAGIEVSPLADFLATRMQQILGPLLIVLSLVFLELVRFNVSAVGASGKLQGRIESWGVWGAFALGVLFALAFCPVSVGVFFTTILRLSTVYHSRVILPAVFGIGTALPVVGFAVLVAFSTKLVGKTFDVVGRVEWWARRIAGVVFLVVGVLFSLEYCFGVPVLSRLRGG